MKFRSKQKNKMATKSTDLSLLTLITLLKLLTPDLSILNNHHERLLGTGKIHTDTMV